MVLLPRPVSLAYNIHKEETEADLCALGILDNGDINAGYIINFQKANTIVTMRSKPQRGTGSVMVFEWNGGR